MDLGGGDETQGCIFGSRSIAAVGDNELVGVY